MTEADIKAGAKFSDVIGEIRIMAVAEKYAMVRRKGCMVFVLSFKEIIERAKGEKINLKFKFDI